MLKEYIVSLNKGISYDEFWNQIENLSTDDGFVPTRRVDIVNNRDGSLRSCHYALTDEEAKKLQKDPRVYSVEIPLQNRDDVVLSLRGRQTGTFTKTSSSSGNFANWGLKRVNSSTNLYGTNFTTSSNYDYILDGTGVDVVIQDSGIEVNHPEFYDENGVTRVQQINWYTESGLAGTQNANHYRDFDGHGTHVAGIVAGRNFGWAKNARIYSVKVRGLEGAGDTNTGIIIADCFDVIKLWHRNKPVDPATGYKRPTIVNMSWGYSLLYTSINSLTYRGVTHTDSETLSNVTYRWWNYGLVPLFNGAQYITNLRQGQVDVDIQELIDEGVHVVIAAGNNYHKIDVPGGEDYNNEIDVGGSQYYYHQGSSPLDDEAFKVGNIDSSVINASTEQKNVSSETGPGVDVWAPGSNIMSCTSNTNEFSSATYQYDPGFKQLNISGTSMAAPQVCGLGALYLQMNPGIKPAQLKKWVIQSATINNLYNNAQSNVYTDLRSLMGGYNRMLYNPVGLYSDGNLEGQIVLQDGALTLT